MRMIFVRHGEPDYEHDCLTDRGLRQAEAAAERLKDTGIEEIYASPMGRAQQTAACTAGKLGLPIHTLDYMHEISWGGPGLPDDGHPWILSERMICRDNCDLIACDWRKHPYYATNAVVRYYNLIAGNLDRFLAEQGYTRDGVRYYCAAGQEKTIALFSHGGAGGCALAHILNLPFPYVAAMFPFGYASVIVVDLPVRPGEYVHPILVRYEGEEPSVRYK